MEGAGRCEFVEDFAKPYPSLTIATVMGAPLEDAPRLHDWSNWIQRQFDAPSLMNDRARIEQAVSEFYEWCEGMLAARRGDPRDDLVSTLLAAEQEGDRLSEVECMHLVLNVLVGGVDTTQSQLAHARAGCSPRARTSGGCWPSAPSWRPRRWRRCCATSRSRRSRRGSWSRTWSTAT